MVKTPIRSYGFELRTNEWGAIRADKGLLITTYTQDFKNKITHDNPDGFEHLGEHLADSKTLMQEASSAVSAMDAVISGLNDIKKDHMSELASGILSMVGKEAAKTSLGGMAAAMQAFAAAGSKSGTGPEMQMPLNTDPALPGANDLLTRSKDINKPIVSIVSPEGHSMISPKPVVISSGQSVTMRGTGSVTVSSTQDQLSLLAKAGMLTHVTAGGQRTTVTGGDIAHDAQTGNFNLTAKERITMASTNNDASVMAKQNVNIRANDDSVLIKAGQHIRLEAGSSITLVAGKDGAASLTLKDTGEIEIVGKNGLISFTELLDERSGKILLNCAAPKKLSVEGDNSVQELVEPAPDGDGGKPAPGSFEDIAKKSQSLQADIEQLKKDGYTIKDGPAGGGSYKKGKEIILDSNLNKDPGQKVQVLAHEVGHAKYEYKADTSSKEAYVKGPLGDEGAATMNNIKVQREILNSKGPNIGIAGNSSNHAEYNKAYDAYEKDGNAQKARDKIGSIYGQGEKTSTTGQKYGDYYGDWYDANYKK